MTLAVALLQSFRPAKLSTLISFGNQRISTRRMSSAAEGLPRFARVPSPRAR